MEKQCFKCNETKIITKFYTHNGMKDGYLNKCIICTRKDSTIRARKPEIKANRPHKKEYQQRRTWHRFYALKKNHGITEEQYLLMLENQNKVCKICKNPQHMKNRLLYVDHDHLPGKVRGLLCQKCNSAIGMFNDSLDALQEAIKYLQENK
jgi:hypothetical protein